MPDDDPTVTTNTRPKRRPTPPKRRKNIEVRSREYLTPDEVYRLSDAANSTGRNQLRDKTLILVGYRHALRVSELVSLRWDQVDLINRRVHINRMKRGVPSVQPLQADICSALNALKCQQDNSSFIFISEHKMPLSTATVRKIIARAGRTAGFSFPVHPHMLRHACGYYLANKGHDTRAIQHYLGHRNIQHTVRYTELVSDRFNNFWLE